MTSNSHGFRHLTVALIAILLIAPATAVAIPSPPHEVFGTVTDQDGDVVEGAAVTVTDADGNSHTATTDADGYYEIKFPAADGDEGETLTVKVDGESETTSFAVGTSERIDFEVTVSSNGNDGSDDGNDRSNDDDDDDRNYSNYGDSSSSGDGSTADSSDPDESQSTTAEPTEVTVTQTTEERTTAAPTTEQSSTEVLTTDEATPSSRTGIPGFGPIAAVIALLAVAFVALRRE